MEVILYLFSFGHHGKYSSYARVGHYLTGLTQVDATIALPLWLPDQIAWPLASVLRIFSEYRLLRYYRDRQPRIFHYLYPENSLFQGNFWRKQHHLVLSCHQSPSYIPYMVKKGKSPGFFAGIKTADAVIVLSQSLLPEYRRAMPGCNLIAIPHGIDTGFFCPPAQPPLEKRVLTVGNWLRDYGLWGKVMKSILSSRTDIQFDVVAPPSVLDRLRADASEFPGRVHLWGKISDADLLARYQSASVLFLPLKDAVANNALLESLACGLPSVVTDLPATREYGGQAATYIDGQNVEAYTAALTQILDDRQLRGQLSGAARRQALGFDWATIAETFQKLYRGI